MQTGATGRANTLGVVLLAAGRSRRMERPKMLLPWGDTSVIGHHVRTWHSLGAGQMAVVLSADDGPVSGELARLEFPGRNCLLNPAPQEGMFSSIRCAAKWAGWKSGLTHWAIILGDQPHLRVETLQSLLVFAAALPAKVCQPWHKGHFRHPVILPKPVFHQLRATTAFNLKDFLATLPGGVAGCPQDDPGLDLDIDTAADYEKTLALCGLNSPKPSLLSAPSASNAGEASLH